jgi:DNA-binding MarR family transcriptional regulator
MDPKHQLRELISVPTRARRLYPRGGFAGLEANTLQVLIAIEVLGAPTVGELVNELALAQGTVSTALGRLQQEKLSIARPDQQDRRRERQSITAKGRRLVVRFAQTR